MDGALAFMKDALPSMIEFRKEVGSGGQAAQWGVIPRSPTPPHPRPHPKLASPQIIKCANKAAEWDPHMAAQLKLEGMWFPEVPLPTLLPYLVEVRWGREGAQRELAMRKQALIC